MKVLHLVEQSPIIAGYFDFLQEIDELDVEHTALAPPRSQGWEQRPRLSVVVPVNRISWGWQYLRLSTQSNKIFVHGLTGRWLTLALASTPWVLAKSFWLIWGADLYRYRRRDESLMTRMYEVARRFVISRIGHLVTYLDGDIELARTWYGAAGKVHNCLLYPSNTVVTRPLVASRGGRLMVQVGNSADPANHHEEIFRSLALMKESFIVIAPLAYGDAENRAEVLAAGKSILGERFSPQIALLPLPAYLNQLEEIDVAIFNHRRQQAMGNTIALLGMGKRVFIRRSTPQWQLLHAAGINVSAVEDGLVLERLAPEESSHNIRRVAELFSVDRLRTQWKDLLRE